MTTRIGKPLLVCAALLMAARIPAPARAIKDGEVLIERDRWGVPHISGNSARAVAFGAGYAQAEDHLDRMLRLFLKARGELAAVEGQSALTDDFTSRMLSIPEIVDAEWEGMPPSTREFHEFFARGINRYMETHAAQKQPWHRPVRARDVAVYLKFTILRNGLAVARQKMGLGGGADFEGSNAWAVAASRSASGKAMLLADPHLPWQGDLQWYESHLRCPEFDIAGAAFFGIPVPALGHNGRIAWTATNNGADIADIYLEKIDPGNPDRYLDSDGQWKLMERRVFRVDVRLPDGGMKTVERAFRYTRRGPYVPGRRGREYSIALSAWKGIPDTLTGMLRRAAARDLKEFRASLTEYPMDKWNLVYADRSGNIFTVDNGLFPRRDSKLDWRKPVPGWEPAAQWKGLLPFGELPQFSNPASGLIVQCNNPVYSAAQPPPLDPAKFPPYLASPQVRVRPDTRAGRAYELLGGKARISWEEHRAAALDVRAITAGPLVQALLSALDGQPGSKDLDEIRSILMGWDYMATIENRAIPILGHFLAVVEAKGLDEQKLDRARTVELLKEAAAEMRKYHGSVSVPMAKVQVLRRGTGEYPMPGAGRKVPNPFTSLFMTTAGGFRDGKIQATGGSSWLMLLAFDTPMKVFSVMPVGQSEDPASPHFTDQTELFSRREVKPFPFEEPEVRKHLEKSYTLRF